MNKTISKKSNLVGSFFGRIISLKKTLQLCLTLSTIAKTFGILDCKNMIEF
jgi:hypothetical protein